MQFFLAAMTAMFAAIILFPASDAFCAGFGIYTHDASTLGQGNSSAAHTDGPGAIFFNPALIILLDGTRATAGTTLISISRRFKSAATGNVQKTESAVFAPSHLYVSDRRSDRLSVGLGVFSPFGLGGRWKDDWDGRYITTNAEMRTLDINPVAAYRLTDKFTVAAGPDVLLADAVLENKINLSPYGLGDGSQRFKGSGYGLGYTVGILYDITPTVAFGASYRSGIRVEVDGRAEFGMPQGTPAPIASAFPNTDGRSKIELPPRAHGGISWKASKNLVLEAGVRWEGWSSFDRFKIRLDQPVAGSKVSDAPKRWRDVVSVNVGGKYRLSNMLALRAGYLRGGNAVPGDTYEPTVPDADTQMVSVGTEITLKKWKFDLSYTYQWMEGRSKHNLVDDNPTDAFNPATAASGRYNLYAHIVGISATYKF